MKIVNFRHADGVRLGFLVDNEVIDALAVAARGNRADHVADTMSFIRSGEAGKRAAELLLMEAPSSARYPLRNSS